VTATTVRDATLPGFRSPSRVLSLFPAWVSRGAARALGIRGVFAFLSATLFVSATFFVVFLKLGKRPGKKSSRQKKSQGKK
jgi:hypothetical protein